MVIPAPPHPLDLPQGRAALALASSFADPSSLAAATALRREFDPELAALAAHQVSLRAKARTKLGPGADAYLLTSTGLEQATRPRVAVWRAEQLRERGITRLIDLGCGLGFDALAAAQLGIEVIGVERDPLTAGAAAHQLAPVGGRVLLGDVEQAQELWAGADASCAVFIDPARRSGDARSWNLSDLSPSWTFVESLAHGDHHLAVKLGPGVDRGVLPESLDRVWVSDHGDVVEASLFTPLAGTPPRAGAVMLGPNHQHEVWRPLSEVEREAFEVAPIGDYLHEPDGALSRSRLVPALADELGVRLWSIDPHVGYLSSDQPIPSPWLHSYRVLDQLDPSVRSLRAWAQANRIGVLEIKKRGLDLDPAQLRRQLKLKGSASATLVLTPTPNGAVALVAQRI